MKSLNIKIIQRSLCAKLQQKKSNDQTELFISDAFRVEKPVKVSFAPELSNFGGLSLIAKSDKESGLCEKFASLIPEWRNETLLVHSLPQLVRQRVYQIAAGFEDANDCDDLRHDCILKMCVGRCLTSHSLFIWLVGTNFSETSPYAQDYSWILQQTVSI